MTTTLRLASLSLLVLFAFTAPARAEVQQNVTQTWPGKVMVGVRPLGAQVGFTDGGYFRTNCGVGNCGIGVGDRALYKASFDIAGIIASPDKLTVWLGGEVNVGGRGNLAFIEPGVFVMLTFEKFLKIPLVPLVHIGLSGPVYVPVGYSGAEAAGAFQIKVGAGAYYFLTKNIGVGGDMHFAAGPGFFKNANNDLFVGASAYWDLALGARFAF